MLGMIVLYLLIAAWLIVITIEFVKSVSRTQHTDEKELTFLSEQQSVEDAISINREESILIGDKLGQVRISFLSCCCDDRVRLGLTVPRDVKVYRKEKDSRELVSDNKLYEKELKHWRNEIKRSDKKRKDHESLVLPKVDNELLDGKSFHAIARKCGVSIDFVAKRHSALEKAGSFDTPLFDMVGE